MIRTSSGQVRSGNNFDLSYGSRYETTWDSDAFNDDLMQEDDNIDYFQYPSENEMLLFNLNNEPEIDFTQKPNNTDFSHVTLSNENVYQNNINQKSSLFEGSTPGISTRASKRKVDLSSKANMFKFLFYQVFTSKKKFPKKLVKEVHDVVCGPLELSKMTRQEFRSIDLYFRNYSKDSERILIYLQQHKEELLGLFPELLKLK